MYSAGGCAILVIPYSKWRSRYSSGGLLLCWRSRYSGGPLFARGSATLAVRYSVVRYLGGPAILVVPIFCWPSASPPSVQLFWWCPAILLPVRYSGGQLFCWRPRYSGSLLLCWRSQYSAGLLFCWSCNSVGGPLFCWRFHFSGGGPLFC